ncbi:thymidine phosphorylase [Fulvimarina sp. MAC3]|uniref:thymidine phosphorylase n=1 Tax=Fulvimarina sp. MAC3 TaxID=3148887 RepID=UPI0031FE3BEE
MLPQEIIRKIRDGEPSAQGEIAAFVAGMTDGSISEAQAAAFAMAVFFRGLDTDATVALTQAMRDSGRVLDWPDDDRPVLDKHSTGGIGDNVSLILAPILAACGARVPMISGRGLGHTGGTLDKLDAIPGYQTAPHLDAMKRAVDETGLAIVASTADLAPADKRLYGIRDVTATVDSVPLIVASILSKKLAAGTDALVLDVKTGSGAFMESLPDALDLAQTLVSVANGAGLKTTALITDMNEPLASAAGNAVEVSNAIAFLTAGHRDARLEAVTLALAAELLQLANLAASENEGFTLARNALETGKAAERFGHMISALGGPADCLEHPGRHLANAQVTRPVFPEESGHIGAIDTRMIGLAVISLGGGRRQPSDVIDHSVGFTGLSRIGETVGPNQPIATVHARSADAAEHAAKTLRSAYRITAENRSPGPVIHHRIDQSGQVHDADEQADDR